MFIFFVFAIGIGIVVAVMALLAIFLIVFGIFWALTSLVDWLMHLGVAK